MKTNQKYLSQEQFFELFDTFIKESINGKRLKKDGRQLRTRTITSYAICKNIICEFAIAKNFPIKLFLVNKQNKRELEQVKKYWQKFYKKFTDYLYNDCNYFDNYVRKIIKTLRLFMGYLNDEKNLLIGSYYKSFYCPAEQIPIVVISPEQLNYLIYDKPFNESLSKELQLVKDIFVFGCSVALRYSDLMALNKTSLQFYNKNYYLQADAIKTGVHTNIKLPDYAIEIIEKRKNDVKSKTLFPTFTLSTFNNQLKSLGRIINLNEPLPKYRHKRGQKVTIYKNKTKKEHYTVADYLSSHTMRRTAITTMLRLGMPEHLVRKISGHAPNSVEFERYVSFAQSYIDEHTDMVFSKIKNYDPVMV